MPEPARTIKPKTIFVVGTTSKCWNCRVRKPILTDFEFTETAAGYCVPHNCIPCGGRLDRLDAFLGKGGRKKADRAPRFKEGYAPGEPGWLLEDYAKWIEQKAICKAAALKAGKDSKDYKRYWMGYFKAAASADATHKSIIQKWKQLLNAQREDAK